MPISASFQIVTSLVYLINARQVAEQNGGVAVGDVVARLGKE